MRIVDVYKIGNFIFKIKIYLILNYECIYKFLVDFLVVIRLFVIRISVGCNSVYLLMSIFFRWLDLRFL